MNIRFKYRFLLLLSQKLPRSNRLNQTLGFTLTELLVTIIISSIILSSLLWLVVNLLNTDQREYALSETQRDMQRTLNYIAADMKEAVYIYDGSCNLLPSATRTNNSCPSYVNFLPANSGTPVLAFWKTDPVSSATLSAAPFTTCSTSFTGAKITECEGLRKKRHTYSLVVYSQDTATGSEWEGKSRIYRYELPKYATLSSLTRNQGYVDPAEASSGVFQTWPYIGSTATNTNLQSACTSNCPNGVAKVSGVASNSSSRVALTDFVDEFLPTDLADPTCDTNYQLVPRSASGAALSRTFYACIRSSYEDKDNDNVLDTGTGEDFNGNGALDITNSVSANQDAIIYLRGNAAGRAGNVGDRTFTPVLSTQITMRGVIDKVP